MDVLGVPGIVQGGVHVGPAVAEDRIHEAQRRPGDGQIRLDGVEIPVVGEEGEQGLRQLHGADADHDVIEQPVVEIGALGVLVGLFIGQGAGVVHQ